MGRKKELTMWQLEVLLEAFQQSERGADPAPTLSDVASSLGATRQQVVGALDRLEEALATGDEVRARLVEERSDGLYIAHRSLAERARSILNELEEFKREAQTGSGRWWITCDGYWAHLALFLADAILDLEARHENVHVELAAQFGESRSQGGSGLAGRVRRGEVDIAIAPSPIEPVPIPGVERQSTHRVLLLAAIGPDHPLQHRAQGGRLDVRELADPEITLLTSPKGHFSRDLIDLYQTPQAKFRTEIVGVEPLALAALGVAGSRTPVVASDSALSLNDLPLPTSWLYLVDPAGRLLGREYSVYHRTFVEKSERSSVYGDTRFVPREVDECLRELAQMVVDRASASLGARDPWPDEPLAGEEPRPRGRPPRRR